ncbi:MAG TPA: universal stress protein [Usitatibacter sp.]|nr:universal stress protein [Casimicrobiaceae bacterium]HTS85256.1 universal stress protein [Usitatibacter sp.]
MFKRILFPTDGSEISRRASDVAIELARKLGVGIVGFHTIPPFSIPISDGMYGYVPAYSEDEYFKACNEAADAIMKEVGADAKKAGVAFTSSVVTAPAPWQAIIQGAKDNDCDLIVMASHGRKGVAGVLLGSEATKVLTHSKVPVMVCR